VDKRMNYESDSTLSTLMKEKSMVMGLPLLAVTVLTFGGVQTSHAQELAPKLSNSTPQLILAQQNIPVAQGDPSVPQSTPVPQGAPDAPVPQGAPVAPAPQGASITPSTPTGGLPTNYGLFRSASNGVLEVRLLDGTSQQLTVPSNLAGSASGLQQGSLVGFDRDASGNLTRLEPAEVDRTVEGTISSIDEDMVTIQSSSGETMTTPIDTATISRLNLVPGKGVKVTSHKGTWATTVCCVEAPPAPVTPQPPSGGGTVQPPTPTRALW
jgi:hypothetical protein